VRRETSFYSIDQTHRKVLIIDADEKSLSGLSRQLKSWGYLIETADGAVAGLRKVRNLDVPVVLINNLLSANSGIDLVSSIISNRPGTLYLMMMENGDEDPVKEALERGAYDYLVKPIKAIDLKATMNRAFDHVNLIREKLEAKCDLRDKDNQLTRINARLHLMVESAERLRGCRYEEELDHLLLDEFARNMATRGGSLFRCGVDRIELVHSLDPDHVPAAIPIPLAADSVFRKVLNEKCPIIVEDIGCSPDVKGSGWAGYKNGSFLIFPLIEQDGRIAGLISLHDKEWPPFTKQDLKLAQILMSLNIEKRRSIRAGSSLQKSEEQFRILIENSMDMISVVDENGIFKYISPSVRNVLGYEPCELTGTTSFDYYHPDEKEDIEDRLGGVWSSSVKERTFTHRFKHANGTYRILESAGNQRLQSGPIRGIVVNSRDVTAKEDVTAKLRGSKERLRAFMESASDGFMLLDSDLNFITVNPAAEKLGGIKREDIIGKNLSQISPDVIEKGRYEKYLDVIRTGKPYSEDSLIFHSNLGSRVLRMSAFKVENNLGMTVTDISEIVAINAALEYRFKFENLLSSISNSFINLSANEIDEGISRALAQIGGFVEVDRTYIFLFSDNLKKMNCEYEWCAPGVEPQYHNLNEVFVERDYPWFYERIRALDPIHIPRIEDLPDAASAERIEFEKEGIKSLVDIPMVTGGKLIGFVGYEMVHTTADWKADTISLLKFTGEIIANTLDRKRKEAELAKTQALLTATIEQSPAGILIADAPDVKVRLANPAAFRIRGESRVQPIDSPFDKHTTGWPIFHPDGSPYAPDELPLSRAAIKGETTKNNECIIRRPTGEERWVLSNAAPVYDKDRKIVAAMAVFSDITERKQAAEQAKQQERQLYQAAKLASLGTLVSGVAHEINNPNNFIRLSAENLSEFWGDIENILDRINRQEADLVLKGIPYKSAKSMIIKMIDGLVEGSRRIETLILSLKEYAHSDDEDLNQAVNINEVIQSAIPIINNLILKSTDKFSTHYETDLPSVRGNFHQIEQVIMNLLTNACQALTDRKQGVTITTRHEPDGGWVTVIVKDEGVGISEEDLPRVTDPFFTTKRDSGGTGLGLPICCRIIKTHGGSLSFTSVPGEGASAHIKLSTGEDARNK
jgi:PAS domain S-box-containing protein